MNPPDDNVRRHMPAIAMRVCAAVLLGIPLGYLVLHNLANAPLPWISIAVIALCIGTVVGILLSRRILIFMIFCVLGVSIVYRYWGAVVPFLQ